MDLIFLWGPGDCCYSPLPLRLSVRKGSCYHSFHPAVVLASTSVDILLPFIACPDPTPIGVGGFGHLCRGCCAGLDPSAAGRPHSGARTLPALSCTMSCIPKRLEACGLAKLWLDKVSSTDCILWNESSHYAALLACVCFSWMVLISSCPVTPWLIRQCQLW